MSAAPPPFFLTPKDACVWIGERLEAAVKDPGDAWHLGAITYVGAASAPVIKTIVLREWDAKDMALSFYTDTRSAKWSALSNNPTLALMLYCPIRLVQLSLQGRAYLSQGSEAERAKFAPLSQDQKSVYQSVEAPGTKFDDQSPPPLKSLNPELADTYFGRVKMLPLAFDFVSLHREGHQRLVGPSILDPKKTCWVCP